MSFQAFMKNKHHVLLSLLLIVFIVFDIQVPEGVAVFIDSIVGKALIIIITNII